MACLIEKREAEMKKDVRLTSSLRSGLISKDSDEIWGVGSVDEANSFIGLAKVRSEGLTREILEKVQRKMFNVGAEMISGKEMITKKDVEELEEIIRVVGEKVEQPDKFIILEQDEITAYLSVARAVVRRAERWAVRLNNEGKVGISLVEWLNKLSCLLYLLILYELKGRYNVVQIEREVP